MAVEQKTMIAKCVFITDIVAILYNRIPDAFGSRSQSDLGHFLYKKFFGEGVTQWTIEYNENVVTIKARRYAAGYMFYLYTKQ